MTHALWILAGVGVGGLAWLIWKAFAVTGAAEGYADDPWTEESEID